MGENSAIEWTDHTFNPWSGCTKVSPGCANCYAESMARRFPALGDWGPGAERKRTSAANWRKPLAWNRAAGERLRAWGEIGGPGDPPDRPRVFCASLADWLDPEVPAEWLADLLALIAQTPHMDWLLLTKRPELWRERLLAAVGSTPPPRPTPLYRLAGKWLRGEAPPNVWVGATVEDQLRAEERMGHIADIPARVRFLSCEPLLGPVDLGLVEDDEFHWVIAGGESGPGARPMHPGWARSLRDQCQAAGVPFFFKQWGAWAPICGMESSDHLYVSRKKGDSVSQQAAFDEIYGQRCTVENGIMHNDGEVLQPHEDGCFRHGRGGMHMFRVGKKAAGRLLDGRMWDEVPSL